MKITHTVKARDGGVVELTYARQGAIAAMCTECLGWEDHPKNCTSTMCPLYPFRAKTMKTQHGVE